MEIKLMPIDEIELDKTNPRIAKYLEMYGVNITAEQISLALGVGDSQLGEGGTTFQSLKASIKTNGGVIHPIIVNKESDGNHRVIEGNTRLAIYKEFNEDERIHGNWGQIPAVVHKGLSDEQIDAIRLQAHLVGPRPWDPYSKAKYLDYLYNNENLPMSQIVDYCGGRKREVVNYIEAYKMMESHYRPQLSSDDEFDTTRFSAFVEYQNPRVKEAVISSGFNEDDFSKWIIDYKIYPLWTVRRIPNILENPRSKEIFLNQGKGAAKEALKILEIPSEHQILKDIPIAQLTKELLQRILSLPYGEIQRLKSSPTSDEVLTLMEVRDQLIELCKDVCSEE